MSSIFLRFGDGGGDCDDDSDNGGGDCCISLCVVSAVYSCFGDGDVIVMVVIMVVGILLHLFMYLMGEDRSPHDWLYLSLVKECMICNSSIVYTLCTRGGRFASIAQEKNSKKKKCLLFARRRPSKQKADRMMNGVA